MASHGRFWPSRAAGRSHFSPPLPSLACSPRTTSVSLHLACSSGQFLTYFTNLGLAPALIMRVDLDRKGLGTGLSLLLLLNLASAIVLAVAAPFTAKLLGVQSGPTAPRAALAVPVAFGGFSSFYGAIMRRELEFPRSFVSQLVQAVAMAVVAVVLAALGAGVWSLVVGQIVGTAAYTLARASLAPYRVRPTLDLGIAPSLWRSSRGFMLQGGFSFIEQNTDYLVVGSILGSKTLGVYSMGISPHRAAVQRNRGSDRSDDVPRIRPDAPPWRGRPGTLPYLAPPYRAVRISDWVAAGGRRHTIRSRDSGAEAEGVIAVLPILGLWGSVRTLQGTVGWFVNATGFSTQVGVSYAVLVSISIPAPIAGAELLGVKAVAWVMVADVFVMLGIVTSIASARVGVSLRRQWAAVRTSVVASVLAFLAVRAIAELMRGSPPALALAGSLVAGVAAYAAVVFWAEPGLPREAVQQALRALRRGGKAMPEPSLPASERPPA